MPCHELANIRDTLAWLKATIPSEPYYVTKSDRSDVFAEADATLAVDNHCCLASPLQLAH